MKLLVARTTLKKVLLVCCGLVAGLLLAEGALRVARVSHPLLYAPDEYCASRLRAGARGWWTSEGQAFITVNSAGYRDREHAVAKPPETFRIAVMGDSYAEALQVPLEETFWSILERKLQACDAFRGRRVEVLNFGVSRYGTAEELLMLRHHVWQYEPDLVLLAFCIYNDVHNNSKALTQEDCKPYFNLQDGQLVLDTSFRQTRQYQIAISTFDQIKCRFINASYLLQLVWHARRNWNRPPDPQYSTAERAPAAATIREAEYYYPIYRAPRDPVWDQAWRVTERLLVEMAAEVRRHSARFSVVTLSNGIQVFPDPAVRRRFFDQPECDDPFYTDHRVRKIGEQNGFPVLNLAPPLQRLADEKKVFLHGFPNTSLGTGHWNAAGHQAAADLLTEWLCGAANPNRSDKP